MNDDFDVLDPDDIGLKAVFGDRFYYATKEEVADAEFEPVESKPNGLKSLLKWGIGFGALCLLIFYWQQAGLVDPSVALPCMCVCTALAGYGVGKNGGR